MSKHFEPTLKNSEVKSFLQERFNLFVESISEKELKQLGLFEKNNNFMTKSLKNIILNNKCINANMDIRNQIAFSKAAISSLKRISEEYNLLSSQEVCDILNISRQALSKKVLKGQILAYSLNNKKKFYPSFQIEKNSIINEIEKLREELKIDYEKPQNHNLLLNFLTKKINFSDVGEEDNFQAMHYLLKDKDAFKIIVRNFKNRTSI